PIPAMPFPWLQMPPPGLSRRERRDWYREQRHNIKDAIRAGYAVPELPVEQRIARFRRSLAGNSATMVMLAGINIMTSPRFFWAIFPILGMSVGLVRQLGSLWGDGVPLRQILFGPNRPSPAQSIGTVEPPDSEAALGVPLEILNGPHGVTIRRAAASRQVIPDLLKRMTPTERSR